MTEEKISCIKKLIIIITIFSFLLPLSIALSQNSVKISNINYDPPGSDKENLNGEWVEIENIGDNIIYLEGWSISDEYGHTYYFPNDFRLEPGERVKIHTGSGKDTEHDLYWQRNWPVWNNDGDTVFLKKSGKLIDKYSYGKFSRVYYWIIAITVVGAFTLLFVLKKRKKQQKTPLDLRHYFSTQNYHEMGKDFEKFVIHLFDEKEWIIEDWTRDMSRTAGRLVRSDLKPDIIVTHRNTGRQFAIECKYRSNFVEGRLESGRIDFGIWWANRRQIENYRKFHEEFNIPVFILIGIGGRPTNPEKMFLIPFRAMMRYEFTLRRYLERFERPTNRPFSINEFI